MPSALSRAVPLALLLAGVWILLSGHFTALLLSLGAVSIIAIVWISWRMDAADADAHPIRASLKLPSYWLWLLLEILKANLDVIKRVFAPLSELKPAMTQIQPSQKTAVGRVIYANSITLTPGTISMQIDENNIQIHAIAQSGVDDLIEGDMDRRASAAESGDNSTKHSA